jgi:dTDP-4-dehydrorhamnose reductase
MSEKITVLVLGASGMLGGMLCRVLGRDPALEIHGTVRRPEMIADLAGDLPGTELRCFNGLADSNGWKEFFSGYRYIINAVGVIKQTIREGNPADVRRAILVNSLFPHRLAESTAQFETEILQIATDCVFTGEHGDYLESAPHDTLDVYGKTKSLGEVNAPHVHHLRCSIVGPDPRKAVSLLEWLLQQGPHGWVRGFDNHFWNGLTTYHFARICHGIIRNGLTLRHLQHVVPADKISKLELLRLFAEVYGRTDLMIEAFESDVPSDRSLATLNPELNLQLWQAAGYERPPTIPEMLTELAGMESNLGYPARKAAA